MSKTPHDGLPPQNLVAEKSLLGSLMLDNDTLDEVLPFLSADKFYSDINAMVFSACVRLHNVGNPFDIVTLSQELQDAGQLNEVGGPPYLSEILETVPHAAHAKYYGKLVANAWKLRIVNRAGSEMIRMSIDKSESIDDVLGKVETTLHGLIEETNSNKSISIGDMLLGALDQRVRGAGGVKTGFDTLDGMTNGLHGGQLIVVAARPTVGKSALVTNIAQNFIERGDGVYFATLEMSVNDVIYRLVARLTGLLIKQIRSSDISYHTTILDSMHQMNRWPLFIDDTLPKSVAQIAATARSLKRKRGIKLVIVDYLQLVEPSDRRVNREQQVATMTRGLKVMAKQLDLPVIILSQLNRGNELQSNRRPRMSDLRESGAIEQDADGVWLLHRAGMSDVTAPDDFAELLVVKNRQGPTGDISLTWNGPRFLFGDNGPKERSIEGVKEYHQTQDPFNRG